jgi:hypothetical protein
VSKIRCETCEGSGWVEDAIPNRDGRFADHTCLDCSGAGEVDGPNLGLCCECGERPATGMMMLPWLAPMPGTGWGCVICDLPANGAVAVLCDPCADKVAAEANHWPRFVCVGYAQDNKRKPLAKLPSDYFGHDRSKHVDDTMLIF